MLKKTINVYTLIIQHKLYRIITAGREVFLTANKFLTFNIVFWLKQKELNTLRLKITRIKTRISKNY